jgi:hypothetical protein
MKNARSILVLVLCFLLGLVTVNLLTGCQANKPADSSAPDGGDDTSSDDSKTSTEDVDDVAPDDAEDTNVTSDTEPATSATVKAAELGDGGSGHELLSFELDEDGNPVIVAGDWSQWGGTSYRNNVPVGTNIPTSWAIGSFDRKTYEWNSEGSENIKWVARVGSQTYGNPVSAAGKIYVGTNNSAGYLARYPAAVDLGCMICFDAKDGSFLWQHSSEKLSTGRVHDWPLQGICCAPLIEGERMWFVTSRGEVVCVDTEGYYDGEDDGPVKNERAKIFSIRRGEDPATDKVGPAVAALNDGDPNDYILEQFKKAGIEFDSDKPIGMSVLVDNKGWDIEVSVDGQQRNFELRLAGPRLNAFKVVTTADTNEADTIWRFNMMQQLKVSQHNMCSCSVTALGDILFINTSNALDESHINLPSPDAPSFVAMDKNTGEVYWTDKSPGTNILHGQWSSPTVAIFDGVPQVVFAGGDGWVYSFRADEGKDGDPELLWKFDANPKESKWVLGGRGTRNNIIATPVVYKGMVYVAVGQDPEHGEGVGHLWCLDPNKRGDVSPELAISVESGEPIPHRRLQAVIAEEGEVARDNPNSAVIWHYSSFDQNGDGEFSFEEQMHRSCGTVAIKDDILFIADFSGLFHCLDAMTGKVHWTYDMLAAAWGSPLIVNDYVYIGDEDGDISIFPLSADKDVALKDGFEPGTAEINMSNSVYSTPIVIDSVLYIVNKTHLFAIEAAGDAAAAQEEGSE